MFGPAAPPLDRYNGKNIFPYIQFEPLLPQYMPIVPYPPNAHHCEASSFILVTSLQALGGYYQAASITFPSPG